MAVLLAMAGGCAERGGVPLPGSAEHARALTSFHVGLAAYQAGDDERADARFAELTRLAPAEPAGWADWGALALRQGRLDAAAERLERARSLAPAHADILLLLGLVHSRAGRSAEAVAVLRRAAEAEPHDAHAATALAEEIERGGGPEADAQAQALMQQVLSRAPDNVAAQVEVARLAAKRGDAATLATIVQALAARANAWPTDVQAQARALAEAAGSGDLRAAALRTTRLRNVLQQVPQYREGLAAIRAPSIAQTPVLTRLIAIASPPARPAAPDTALRFDVRPGSPSQGALWALVLHLDGTSPPAIAIAAAPGLVLPGGATLAWPGGLAPATPEGVLALDHSYDFRTDLVLAGPGGVRLYRQDDRGAFADVTATTGLPRAVTDGAYAGAWTVDIESDGDLDVVLGAAQGETLVLQNNGDGTFAPTRPFAGAAGLRQALWVDMDGDGTPDAAFIDGQGRLQLRMNRRLGRFEPRDVPATPGTVRALAAADLDNDGRWDLLTVGADGAITALSPAAEAPAQWRKTEVARVPPVLAQGELRLRIADLDNNGSDDLLLMRVGPAGGEGAAGAVAWLGGAGGIAAHAMPPVAAGAVTDLADLDGDGRLDLVGVSAGGAAMQAMNAGTRPYHWQVVRPRAAQAHGDQRINPFAIGGEVELRAGSDVQRRIVTAPVVHFGLGEHRAADIVRVHWPNGVMQAEFDAPADGPVLAEQRLKGSCPFLFAHDGTQVRFVKDAVPWGSAIGLRINTIGTAKVEATEEWYRVGRDQLAARDGFYDLRITAELWEVYYYDHFALAAVDHPPGTEVFVDERFAIPPVKPRIVVVDTPRPLARAVDDRGRDVTQLLASADGRQVDSFGHGQYQGVTRDHHVELDLGPDAVDRGPLLLVAHGSLRPTDSSINVALSQGRRWRPQGMSLEVPDGQGGWRVARRDLGFPAGRRKTVLLDLDGLFAAGAPRRVRIRTNLEIYWDHIEWARARPDMAVRVTPLEPSVADLRYRGYSVLDVADAGAPEVPDYGRLAGTAPRWRDLAGYYTRHGDVRELLRHIDDRYVIMNAGDEMRFLFPEPAAAPAGWLRDFVVMGDGWIKDGDFNSDHSRTVQPLPHHGEQAYTKAPVALADEQVVRRHPHDWDTFHTRYVDGGAARDAVRNAP
jgi:Tfp pilus assembly protein PilF